MDTDSWNMDGLIRNTKLNCIQLPNNCLRGCFFCFLRQQGKKFSFDYNIVPVKVWIDLFEYLNLDKPIEIVGGDVFNYPGIYEIIIELIKYLKSKNKRPTISISSTYADFDLSKLDLLKSYDYFGLRLNAITFDTNFKNKIMAGGWNEEHTNKIKKLISSGVLSNIVMWNFGSTMGLKKDLEILKDCLKDLPKDSIEINLTYPSATKYANPVTKKYNEIALRNYNDAVKMFKLMLKDYPKIQVDIVRDVSMDCFDGLNGVDSIKTQFSNSLVDSIGFLKEKKINLSEVGFIANNSFYNFGFKKFPNLNWINIASDYFGGDITASALLGFKDIEKHIAEKNKFKYYAMTKKMLIDSGGKADLFGRTIEEFEKATGSKAFFF